MVTARYVSTQSLETEFAAKLKWAEEIYVAVAWASTTNPCHSALLKARDRVQRLVVGLHFHQTDPEFIRAWRGKASPLTLIQDLAGVFHPKVYLFRKGKQASAFVGSANFTGAGFGKNTEAMLLIAGAWDEAPFSDLLEMIEAERVTVTPNDPWLERYTLAFRQRQSDRRKLENIDDQIGGPGDGLNSLAIDFEAFAELVLNAGIDRAELRRKRMVYTDWLTTLGAIHALPGWPSTRDFDDDDWKKLLGVVKNDADDPSVDYRYFGWNRSPALDQLKANEEAQGAIDRIPARGKVTTRQWQGFKTAFCTGFTTKALQVASRLLVLKRPDLFIAANQHSLTRLQELTGVRVKTLDDYWILHQVIWSWPWARSVKPTKDSLTPIWLARVALLDVLLYQGA